MKKILLILALLTLTISNGQFIVTGGGQSSGVSASTTVSTLANLQGLVSGDVGAITGTIDLVNTNVTIPSGVVIVDGGGSIVSSGTGELTLSQESKIEGSLLNYQLNLGSTTNGQLIESRFYFDNSTWGIDETIVAGTETYGNTSQITIATNNKDRMQKAVDDVKLLNGTHFYIDEMDAFFFVSLVGEEDDINREQAVQAGLEIPSDFNIIMTKETVMRIFPSSSVTESLWGFYEVDNASITGGKLYGTRETHSYALRFDVTTAGTTSPAYITVDSIAPANFEGVFTPAEYSITITPSNATTQATEIAAYFDALPDFTASSVGTKVSIFPTPGTYMVHGTGVSDTSGIVLSAQGTHELEYPVFVVGSWNILVDGIEMYNSHGDGVEIAGNKSSQFVGYRNSWNVTVQNCYIDYARRNGISITGCQQYTIRQNRIYNTGRDMTNSTGTSPRGGIWSEPYGSRDAVTGVKTDGGLVRNGLVTQNWVMDSQYNAIANFTGYNMTISNNYMNGNIQSDFGEKTYITHNTIDFREGEQQADAYAIKTQARVDTYTNLVEITKDVQIKGNYIYGANDGVNEEVGIWSQGWDIEITGNHINFLNGPAFKLQALRRSIVKDNFVRATSTETLSEGLDLTITAFKDVFIENNWVESYGIPIEINSTNADSRYTELGETEGYLMIKGNTFNSLNSVSPYFRVAQDIDFVDNVFEQRVTMNNTLTRFKFIGNNFKEGFTHSGTASTLTDVEFRNNIFTSTTTTAGLDLESRGTSAAIIAGNTFIQTGNGLEAMRIWEGSGGVNDLWIIYDNQLESGSPTEFIDFTGDNSIFKNNQPVNSATNSQTLSGTGNTVN